MAKSAISFALVFPNDFRSIALSSRISLYDSPIFPNTSFFNTSGIPLSMNRFLERQNFPFWLGTIALLFIVAKVIPKLRIVSFNHFAPNPTGRFVKKTFDSIVEII